MSFVSYAQNGEDILLHRVFGGQETGFYVDVGAYDPVNGSVTKAFYDRGWAGINVEPGAIFEQLAAARPRDVNLRMVVLDRAGTALLQDNAADPGMTRVVGESEADGAHEVPCDTLEAIVRRHAGGRPVDFLKVDAEGAEGAIIASTDWRRFRPRVLVFEATLPWSTVLSNDDWEPLLIAGGYTRVFFDGINCFYVPEEERPVLERHFRVPVNVLDGVHRYDVAAIAAASTLAEALATRAAAEAERDIARAEQHAAEAMQARAQAERVTNESALRAELAERDAVEASLRATLAACEAEKAHLAAAHAEAATQAAAAQARQGALTTSLQDIQAAEATVLPAPQEVPPALRFATARRLARLGYGVVRPVVRPAMHRIRNFMMRPQLEALDAVRSDVQRLRTAVALVQVPPPASLLHCQVAPEVRIVTAPADLAEMRRLAAEVERAVLTLAMEGSAPAAWAAESGSAPPTAPAMSTPKRAPLILPNGRRMEVEYGAADLSVGASLAASGGDWEPHVRAFLSARVGADWTCLDIGANIGVHALSLATLAPEGRVIAFEADPANYDLLVRNAKALAPPKACVDVVNLALWDSATTLTIGGADELAGCSFVATGSADATRTEQALRSVVDSVADRSLHLRLTEVQAVRLDDWAAENGLNRLDFIKLDVEGAEAAVIRGADATLRSLRPILLVEYNPACAAAYFGAAPEELFLELEKRFATIHALNNEAQLVRLDGWDALRKRMEAGKGWEDLVCMHL